MLILTRKPGEKIVLPELNVEIIVARVLPNGAVRVGVRAPKSCKILREEIVEVKPCSTTTQCSGSPCCG
jgi:carbon storage regulator CsrA